MSLPDTPRAGLLPPARALAASAIDLTRRLTWHALHPRSRERFLDGTAPTPLTRIDVTAVDGTKVPLFRLDPAPGGHGAPVMLSHGLGFSHDAYRAGPDPLAHRLARAGYRVYFFSHRGDAVATSDASADFDGILELDLPAAVDRVLDDAGASATHWIGHGLGGQLALVGASRGLPFASVVAVGAPVRFDTHGAQWRRLRQAASLVPGAWRLRTDRLARLALPFVGDDQRFGDGRGQAARAMFEYGSQGVSAALLRQVLEWFEHGSLCSRRGLVDHTAGLTGNVPLLVVYGADSEQQDGCTAALKRWRHTDTLALRVRGTDLDLALGAGMPAAIDWLEARRELVWPLPVDVSTAYAG